MGNLSRQTEIEGCSTELISALTTVVASSVYVNVAYNFHSTCSDVKYKSLFNDDEPYISHDYDRTIGLLRLLIFPLNGIRRKIDESFIDARE